MKVKPEAGSHFEGYSQLVLPPARDSTGLPPVVLGCYLPGKIRNFLLFVSLVAHTAVYRLKVSNVIKITIKSVPDKLYVQSVAPKIF